VTVDSCTVDVILAGAAAPAKDGPSHSVSRRAKTTLMDCVTLQQAVAEVERNFEEKPLGQLPELRLILRRCLHLVLDLTPATWGAHTGQADPKDLPILVAALGSRCRYWLTFKLRHDQPLASEIAVLRPGNLLVTGHVHLGRLESEPPEGE
jgi:hypothetical protein